MSLQESAPIPLCSKVDTKGKSFFTTWTDERIERARKLWDDGLSATMIANDLGGITRNAVIGKICRSGWPKRKSRLLAGTHGIKQSRDHGMGAVYSIVRRAATKSRALPKEAITPANFLGVTFMDLGPKQCRYPRGEVEILFCGQPQKDDSSYCAYCHSVAYTVAR